MLALASAAQAQTAPPTATPMRVVAGVEQATLPGDEPMGLMGVSVLWPLGRGWWGGPAVYGAGTGHRGGLFVFGGEVQRRWALPAGWALDTGLYAGGGGGGSAPVGGGLMLRAAATLSQRIGPARAGLSVSHLQFANGDIRSQQLGLVLEFDRDFLHFPAARIGQPLPAGGAATGLGFDRLAATVGSYQLHGTGAQRIGLVGARAEHLGGPGGLVWGIESAAAASGGAAGYMEILANGTGYWAPAPQALPGLQLLARAGLGLGGGGGLPVDGGLLLKGALGARAALAPGWAVGAELGRVQGLNGPMRARSTQLWLAADLEGPKAAGAGGGQVSHNEWAATLQHYLGGQRQSGARAPLSTVGMKINRYQGEHLYLSAQAHSAFTGGAGAYSVGLVGAGLATPRRSPWRAGVELLTGAAGGGGVASGGGLIAQGMAWAAVPAGADSEWRAGVGALRSLRGGALSSGMLEVSWVKTLGLGGR